MAIRDVLGQDSATTRRIIAAASEEFARHGFASARVRQIVDAAHVNLAAVNYYFGGKEGLYRATLIHLASRARAEPSARNRRGHSPEERLHRLVFAILDRYLGAKRPSPLGRILFHEAMNPTEHLDRLIEDMLRPEIEGMSILVRELAGPEVADSEVTHACLSVMGQCLFYLFGRPAIDRIYPAFIGGPEARNALARQITDFSLAGIERLRAPRVISR
jgi:TetR/AcrR family transcriptional regulator, regulator of cefoperazone and chloramphenicol sensitivity